MDVNDSGIFHDRAAAQAAALSLIQQARQQICFFGASLDNVLFNHADCIASLSAFARRTPRAQAHFIVHDSRSALSEHHRLIPLAQTLSSRIHLRNTDQQHRDLNHYILLIDKQGYLYGQTSGRYHGRFSLDAQAENRQWQTLFDTVWEYGHPDLTTRRLSL